MTNVLRINLINTGLIILSCILAHIFPYSLLLFSYAVLGPAHYLTQISWLHDKKYFVATPLLAPICCVLTLFLIGAPNQLVAAVMLSIMFSVAFLFVVPVVLLWRAISLVAGALLIWLVLHSSSTMRFMALLLPTVIHIFVFTACFMWIGAIKSRSITAYISIAALLICAASFVLAPNDNTVATQHALSYFRPVVQFLQSVSPLSSVGTTKLFGFLAFAYTYHYLNWFSKAEVIHWNRIPQRRLQVIILFYVLAISLYAYNYEMGLLLLLFLSQLHIVLEFPLNLRTGGMILDHGKSRLISAVSSLRSKAAARN